MVLKVAQGSLFAVLSRSPWWYSALIGTAFLGIAAIVASPQFSVLIGACGIPFFGIALYAGYRQSKQPSRQRILDVANEARGLSAAQIAAKIADGYAQYHYDSAPFKGKAAELELSHGYRKVLVATKRFKAANTGVEPLRQLVDAGKQHEATGYVYVTLGEVSDAAHEYATAHDIELIQADRLAAFFDGQAVIE